MNAFTAPAKGIDLGRTKSAEQIKKDAKRVNAQSFSTKSYQTNSEKAPR